MTERQPATFVETGLRSLITEFGLALIGSRVDEYYASGTATLIAPNLAITAKHVIVDYWQRYKGNDIQSGANSGNFQLQACQVSETGASGALRNVTKMWLSPHTDVAFLSLSNVVGIEPRALRMNVLAPEVGSRVACFGFHSSVISISETEPGKRTLEWRDSPTTSTGTVVEQHEVRRDSSRLTFPCFRTDARFDGGMSGGPVFNRAGELVGIICSSLPAEVSGGEDTSYVATLWPAFGTVIDMPREGLPAGIAYPILDLAQQGFIHATNWDRIELIGRNGELVTRVGLRTRRSIISKRPFNERGS